jgi:hypothetical protein
MRLLQQCGARQAHGRRLLTYYQTAEHVLTGAFYRFRLLAAVAPFRVLIALSVLDCPVEDIDHVRALRTCGVYAMF